MATAPVANDDQVSYNEGGTIRIDFDDLLANDIENDTTNQGTLDINYVWGDTGAPIANPEDRYIEVQLPTDYYGTFRLIYVVNDGNLKDEGVVEVTINNINDVPLPADLGIEFYMQGGTTLTVENDRGILRQVPNVNVNVNGDPVDGDDYTAVLDQGPSNGTLNLDPQGGFTYTPNAGFTGQDTFSFYVNDGTTNSAQSKTVTINVPNSTDQAPVATDDFYSGTEDQVRFLKSADVLSNDSDPDGDIIQIDRVFGAYGGTVSLEDANIIFTPDQDFNGRASFAYVIKGGTPLEDTGLVFIDFAAVNDAPVPNDEPTPRVERYAAYDDETLTVVSTEGVLFNDTDADGDQLSAALATQASNGTVSLNSDGSFTYTPNAGFTGMDSFEYTVTDGTATSQPTKVEIEVLAGTDGGNGTSLSGSGGGSSGTSGGTSRGDKLTGDGTSDNFDGGGGNDTIEGRGGDDTLKGGSGADRILAGSGNDDITGGSGSDLLRGGVGNDTFRLSFGNPADSDTVDGGSGTDDVIFNIQGREGVVGALTVDLAAGTQLRNAAQGTGDDQLNGVENYRLIGAVDITLRGDAGDNVLRSSAGDDTINGRGGADNLFGAFGNDLLQGGDGDDTLNGALGQDTLFGGPTGDDSLVGGSGNDVVFGETGNDTINGGSGSDVMLGGAGNDLVLGGDGNDSAVGGDGQDTIFGGNSGADTLRGNAGQDVVFGQSGNDVLDGGGGADQLNGGVGDDTVYGGSGADTVLGSDGNDVIYGGANDDVIYGGDTGADTLIGGSGNDKIYGQTEDDLLEGGAGSDTLSGGAGNDALLGGEGNDTLIGGANSDVFVFSDNFGVDRIFDFDEFDAAEVIDLSGVSNIVDFVDLTTNHLSQSGNDAIITDGADTITLVNVNIADLDSGDFVF